MIDKITLTYSRNKGVETSSSDGREQENNQFVSIYGNCERNWLVREVRVFAICLWKIITTEMLNNMVLKKDEPTEVGASIERLWNRRRERVITYKWGEKRDSLNVGDSSATRKIAEKTQGREKEIASDESIIQAVSCKVLVKGKGLIPLNWVEGEGYNSSFLHVSGKISLSPPNGARLYNCISFPQSQTSGFWSFGTSNLRWWYRGLPN